MKIFLGADHGGFKLKETIKQWLLVLGYEVMDLGAFTLEKDDDYPDFSFKVAQEVIGEKQSLGILFCKSGGGVTIAANKVKGVRAVNVFDDKSAVHARVDNNANVITIGAEYVTEMKAKEIIELFLQSNYKAEERHERRLKKILDYEVSS